MLSWKQKPINEREFAAFEKALFRAAEVSEPEIETAATSPFLYRRIRVRIEAEIKRRSEGSKSWGALLKVAQQAIPAFGMIAIFAPGVFWTSPNQTAPGPLGDAEAALLNDGDSQDEMLAELIGWRTNETPAQEVKEQR
jgi:hypothetical protein